MKLRNKKTGQITDNIFIYNGLICVDVWKGNSGTYTTLAELNEEWEDYKPVEPLIKDEKIRKAVKAWAEANGMTCCHYECGEFEQEYGEICAGISFGGQTDYLEERHYTIAELCGEEKE